MLAPLIGSIRRRRQMRDPKSYKVKYVPVFTILGQAKGQGYYIITPHADPFGPIETQTKAEDILLSALEEIRGKPFRDDEKEAARALWRRE